MDHTQRVIERSPATPTGDHSLFEISMPVQPKLDKPQVVSAWVLDLDGTIKPSYENLRAVQVLHSTLKQYVEPTKADKFITDLVRARSFQGVLHGTQSIRAAFEKFITDHDIPITPSTLNKTLVASQQIQKKAFSIYDGFNAFMNLAKSADIPVFIYTNSAIGDAGKSLQLSGGGIDPDLFTAIYARQNPARPAVIKSEWRDASKFAQRSKPYSDYSKPQATPIFEIASVLDIPIRQIAMIGEGSNDARVAIDAGCQFGFHVQGAKDIDAEVSHINERLRPGAEQLGYRHVVAFLERHGMEPGVHYHRLDNGFKSAVEMVEQGKITVRRPPFSAQMQDGQLVRLTRE